MICGEKIINDATLWLQEEDMKKIRNPRAFTCKFTNTFNLSPFTHQVTIPFIYTPYYQYFFDTNQALRNEREVLIQGGPKK
jgi:hypothetical protein